MDRQPGPVPPDPRPHRPLYPHSGTTAPVSWTELTAEAGLAGQGAGAGPGLPVSTLDRLIDQLGGQSVWLGELLVPPGGQLGGGGSWVQCPAFPFRQCCPGPTSKPLLSLPLSSSLPLCACALSRDRPWCHLRSVLVLCGWVAKKDSGRCSDCACWLTRGVPEPRERPGSSSPHHPPHPGAPGAGEGGQMRNRPMGTSPGWPAADNLSSLPTTATDDRQEGPRSVLPDLMMGQWRSS